MPSCCFHRWHIHTFVSSCSDIWDHQVSSGKDSLRPEIKEINIPTPGPQEELPFTEEQLYFSLQSRSWKLRHLCAHKFHTFQFSFIFNTKSQQLSPRGASIITGMDVIILLGFWWFPWTALFPAQDTTLMTQRTGTGCTSFHLFWSFKIVNKV